MHKSDKRDVPLQSTQSEGAHKRLNRKEIAALGEEAACRYLLAMGYRLVCRNWRSGRFGEIDLILQSPDGTLIFVEVKTRRRALYSKDCPDSGFNCIDWRKQRKIIICIRSYLARTYQAYKSCRADVCVVYYQDASAMPQPHLTDLSFAHVPDAFDASG